MQQDSWKSVNNIKTNCSNNFVHQQINGLLPKVSYTEMFNASSDDLLCLFASVNFAKRENPNMESCSYANTK